MALNTTDTAPTNYALNVRKLEREDQDEWSRAHIVQAMINTDELEYTGYAAGVMTYRKTRSQR